MTVGRRLAWSLAVLLICTGLLGVASVAGLVRLQRIAKSADSHHQRLRATYEMGHRAAVLQVLINTPAEGPAGIDANIQRILDDLDRLSTDDSTETLAINSDLHRTQAMLREYLNTGATSRTPDVPQPIKGQLTRIQGQVASLAGALRGDIESDRTRMLSGFAKTLITLIAIFAITAITAAIVGVRQYRSITTPLRSLDSALNQMHSGNLSYRIQSQGDLEFGRLMTHFNHTSQRLDDLTQSMRVEIDSKSMQLIRSERLAGVGYLAAGLAHEINNPLAIIAGNAQASMRHMDSPRQDSIESTPIDQYRDAFQVISEEAFRCKRITSDLLLLAQPSKQHDNVPTRIEDMVARAASLIRALPMAADVPIYVQIDPSATDAAVMSDPAQMLQVLINLLTNGLEACTTKGDHIDVKVAASHEHVDVRVIDHGVGMSSETLDNAFEPFFTDKRRMGHTGCGLGLTISHAIVERFGGRLLAYSDGPGRGSTFTIRMPRASESPGIQQRPKESSS